MNQKEAVAVGVQNNQVYLAFKTPITILRMDATDALMIAEALVKHARNLILNQKPIIEIPKEIDMSLTRDKWEEMWKAIKKIENRQDKVIFANEETDWAINLIKTKIQSVIGQMPDARYEPNYE